eukprot:5102093-Amphidinium_carterae.1
MARTTQGIDALDDSLTIVNCKIHATQWRSTATLPFQAPPPPLHAGSSFSLGSSSQQCRTTTAIEHKREAHLTQHSKLAEVAAWLDGAMV